MTALSERTRVPQVASFREAVEDLLEEYEEPKKEGKSAAIVGIFRWWL